jgi:predicted acetyltransferase
MKSQKNSLVKKIDANIDDFVALSTNLLNKIKNRRVGLLSFNFINSKDPVIYQIVVLANNTSSDEIC